MAATKASSSFPATSSRKRSNNSANKNKKRPGTNDSPTTNSRTPPTPPKTTSTSNANHSNHKPRSIGEAVQQAEAVDELLEVAAQVWLPTDPGLPPHLKTQAIHHEKRQRWSAQLLSKLGDACVLQQPATSHSLWRDDRMARAVLAAAVPFADTKDVTNNNNKNKSSNDKERRAVREALLGLHTMVGHTTTTMCATEPATTTMGGVHNDIVSGVQLLLERAEAMADELSLQDAIEVRWAARGLEVRMNSLLRGAVEDEPAIETVRRLSATFDKLDRRAEGLPFDIIPMGVDFSSNLNGLLSLDDHEHPTSTTAITSSDDIMKNLQESIPFNFDTIVTRQGTSVIERRGTAWVAEEGIGALAYSGKLMKPSPMPDLVRAIMRQVETAIDAPSKEFFDCALCNY